MTMTGEAVTLSRPERDAVWRWITSDLQCACSCVCTGREHDEPLDKEGLSRIRTLLPLLDLLGDEKVGARNEYLLDVDALNRLNPQQQLREIEDTIRDEEPMGPLYEQDCADRAVFARISGAV